MNLLRRAARQHLSRCWPDSPRPLDLWVVLSVAASASTTRRTQGAEHSHIELAVSLPWQWSLPGLPSWRNVHLLRYFVLP